MLGSGMWVCSSDFARNYMVDYRSLINKLRKEGFVIETKRCELHHHDGKLNMWMLTKLPEIQPAIKFEWKKEGTSVFKQGLLI